MISRSVFLLEGAAFDDSGLDLGVVDGHQRERLHHVRAVVAGEAHVDLEIEVTVQALDLVDHILLHLWRVAAGPQQGQHQGGELVAQWQAGKAQAGVAAHALQAERWLAGVIAVQAQADLVGTQALDGFQQ